MNKSRNGPGSDTGLFEPGVVINPVGLIGGAAAKVAIDAGLALPLAGGPLAFTYKEILQLDDTGAIISHVSPITDGSVDLTDITGTRNIFAGQSLSRPLIMGVVNVTPDSFSDGGDHADPKKAIVHALSLIDAGTDILDIGGSPHAPVRRPSISRGVRPDPAGDRGGSRGGWHGFRRYPPRGDNAGRDRPWSRDR